MTTLLIATHNPAKFQELKLGLKTLTHQGIKILSLNDLKIKNCPKETGGTFEENAILKAKFYANLTHLPTIADDGGLIIPALNNEPGVISRRWLGYEAGDEELIEYTLKRLKNYLIERREAYLQVCLCFYNPETKTIFYEQNKIKGHIALHPSPKRIKGYPFRALFIVDKFNKYYDELTDEEHEEINHRLKTIRTLLRKVTTLY